ncbi:glycerophosphoinositol inositolphosphodiesterase GDPD2 [Carassius auratus]|uniref:Glycerophosphoinositol inositolphosphodiesterase GDPD2-like n=1 Tax=Carassius auratus TaxID=7957 RepID=A0A6P6QSB3_CARAU|nr:glycerophosphoinositol inositolphosphodiesterase GDPD2-like [Carassius auratus]XP_026136304.1 glycerophosphoinositol inositolphosphodiesterase GDPD2-like [Carassius auratus]
MFSIFRTCLRGIYSCQWNSQTRTQNRACCWFSFLCLVSILALSWMYVCFIAFNDHDDVNWLAFKTLKKWVSWYMIVMVVSAVLAIYCLLLLVFGLLHLAIREPLNLHCLHKVFLFLGLLTVTLGTAGICIKWKEEWKSVYMSFQATAPFLQLCGVVALTLISWLVFQSYHRAKTAACKVLIMMTFLVVSAAVFLCPLAICSPCITNNLPPKPALIGHRGAPMMAPENTMMSFRKSMECDVVAFETDVQLSKDKKPFLMHDNGSSFLLRTTDVKDKFLGRDGDVNTNFTLEELKTLNAGEWFVRTDPFQSVASLSKEEKMEANNQTVPSLNELLVMAKTHNVSLIFDLKNDENSTGFQNSDSYYTTETIKKSGISQDKIWWLPSEFRHEVRNIAPGFKQVYHNEQDMNADGGSFLNMKYSSLNAHEISELREKNVSVNLWVVNEPWLFSLLWCSGASSVTTNACHILKNMSKPDWHLEPNIYMGIWISADVISLLLMFGLFIWQRRRKSHVFRQNTSERSYPLLPR